MNYSDIGGAVGVSTDNLYYFEGINVTDPVTGTFGANLNTEIIQEQKVITGGIPAEYIGAAGLISNVITKSGRTASRLGELLLPERPPVTEDKNGAAQEFSTKDNAYTFGGPILRDKAWFFGSHRYNNRKDDVAALDTNQFLRSVHNTQHQGFAKGSWAVSGETPISSPTSATRPRSPAAAIATSPTPVTGPANKAATASSATTPGSGATPSSRSVPTSTTARSPTSALRESRVDVLFRGTDTRLLTDEQNGGYGRDLVDKRDNRAVRATLQRLFGSHAVKCRVCAP